MDLYFRGGGEPTIHPQFKHITSWLERENISYGINTNGVSEIACSPVFLKFSIDTGDALRYKEIRGKDKLNAVVENIRQAIFFKDANHTSTNIGVQCVVLDLADVLSFYDKVKSLNVDYIYFRPLEGRTRPDNEAYIIDKIREIADSDSRVQLSYKFGLRDYRPIKCFAQWSVMTINHNGDVLYCCHRPNEIVGNIMDSDIMEKKKAYRPDMSKCEYPCRLSGANKYLDDLQLEIDRMFI